MATKAAKSINLATLDTEEQAIQNRLKEIAAARETAKQETAEKIKLEISASAERIGKILGKTFTIAELANVATAVAKDKPLFAVQSSGGDKTRLTEEEKVAVRADMLARAASLKLGQTPTPLSELATKHGITAQTLANYKPLKSQVDALPGTVAISVTAYELDPVATA
jgi:hypothetical protein